MCGIYGSTKIYSEEIIHTKLSRMAFRGPDHSEYVNIENKLILGHNRLSILDLDSRSNQPFHYRHLTIIFNGEIYNYLDIKRELIKKGYGFRTTSDTEVICAAYLEYGNNCLDYFIGMFAFVIYDEHQHTLFGARDRVGKKPFYYTLSDNSFEFASQISSIAVGNKLTISELAIQKYLLRGYVEDPFSIYEGINKLRPGYAFHYDLIRKEFREDCYWDIKLPPQISKLSYIDAKSRLNSLLKDAIKIRMIADVSIGTFLSGGIDSSLVTAIASKMAGRVNAFSIKFSDKGFDESEYASAVAQHLGINHEIVHCNYEEGIKLIDEINYYYDEPFADSSAIPSMLLAKNTRKYMTVALTGDGGDEVFLGYTRHRWMKMAAYFFCVPETARKIMAAALSKSPNYRHRIIAQYLLKKSMNEIINDTLTSAYTQISLKMLDKSTAYDYVLCNGKRPVAQKIADLDLKLWLPNDGLVKVDRATMAASMEARCPLLDHRIIEFGRSLPVSYRYRGKIQKRILKDILYEYVPKSIVNRPKAGFTMPFKEWFKTELKEYVYDTLSDSNLRMIPDINIPFIKSGIHQHMNSKINFYPEIWRLLVLVNWLKGKGGAPSIGDAKIHSRSINE